MSFRLELPQSLRLIHPVFHVSLLKPYITPESSLHDVEDRPPPLFTGAEEEDFYAIEKILDKKISRKKILYLVKWKGYPIAEATWEPRSQLLEDVPELVKDFESSH